MDKTFANKNKKFYVHSQLLSSLPEIITEVYNNDVARASLKNDLVCRMIARTIGANAVSILLYKGNRNLLYCAGNYIDPVVSKAKWVGIQGSSGGKILNVMKHINILEFAAFTKNIHNVDKAFIEYQKCHFIDIMPASKEEFYEVFLRKDGEYKHLYEKYKKHFRKEVITIDEDSVSGLFYYILTHAKDKLDDIIVERHWKLFPQDNFLITDLENIKNEYKRFYLNLFDNMSVKLDEDGYYIGIPLQANERPIGILRIFIKKNLQVIIPSIRMEEDVLYKEIGNAESPMVIKYKLNDEEQAHNYITKTAHCQNIALILALHLSNAIYIDAMRQIALKENLHNDFTNFNTLANELTEIVNCHGCFIRFSDSREGKASIRGHSESVNEYYNYLNNHGDPYINNETKGFQQVLKDIFYPPNIRDSEEKRVESIQVDYNKDIVDSISYQFFDEKYRLHSSTEWKGSKMKNWLKELRAMFTSGESTFQRFDLNSIVLIPIKDREYGFISLANTSNRPFLIKDIEMIIPVVKRVGIELKHYNMLEAVNVRSNEAFQHGLKILFHQLMSPMVSMRSNIILLRAGTLTEEKYALRLGEMLDTYQNFLDMLNSHQFLFDYLSKGYTTPKYTQGVQFFEFVKEKVRTYQMRAKAEKNIEIRIFQGPKPAKFGFNTDTELLSHVLQSLLDNAIKYSYNHIPQSIPSENPNFPPYGTPNYISVSVSNTPETYEIKIENWGCPIESVELESIKEFYKRGKNATIFAAAGSGIGLFVVKEIVKTLDGQLIISPNGNHTIINLIFKHK